MDKYLVKISNDTLDELCSKDTEFRNLLLTNPEFATSMDALINGATEQELIDIIYELCRPNDK